MHAGRIRAGIATVLMMTAVATAEDFITEFEYGQMLYHDPRGPSCAACHGETGAGRLIASYLDREGKTQTLTAPDIRSDSLETIRQSVQKGQGVMPRYFLTDREIRAIHAYLKKVNPPEKGSVQKLFSVQ